MRAAMLLPLAAFLTLGASPPQDASRPLCGSPARTATSYCTMVFFDAGSAEVARSAWPILDKVVAEIADNEATQVVLTGHSDGPHDAPAAMALSRRMAESVRDHLTQNGVDPALIAVEAHGATQPRGTAASENRRVEIWVMWK